MMTNERKIYVELSTSVEHRDIWIIYVRTPVTKTEALGRKSGKSLVQKFRKAIPSKGKFIWTSELDREYVRVRKTILEQMSLTPYEVIP